ncbi:MAG: MBL fold metallo-hydrolase [Magnetococcales bacterium]|nr:MBL fold metallo-hydrolase [Magnetococcales bacterium]
MTTPFARYPDGIIRIDTGYWRAGFAASYLLVEGEEAVFIETGPSRAVPVLLQALAFAGVAKEQVRAILVTHVHLDHAGGAGALQRHLPNAELLVHPKGIRHLLEPAKLQAGAEAVYGAEQFETILGGITPADGQRTRAVGDGEVYLLNGRRLQFIDAPGHANHHHCIWDAQSGGIFSGDAAGISYRLFDQGEELLLMPATTPVQFDLAASHQTLDRLAALGARWNFVTHFGRIPFNPLLTDRLHRLLDQFAALSGRYVGQPEGESALQEALQQLAWQELQHNGQPLVSEAVCRDWLTMDCALNAQGLRIWRERAG